MLKNRFTFSKFSHALYEKITRSRLFFIVGDLGVEVLYYKNNNLIEDYFAPIEGILEDQKFVEFITKYKKSDAKIILNLKEASLQHESLPVIGSLGKVNPVEKYCESHLHSSDLYTYKVYSIINGEADLWKSVIIWTPITSIIEKCLLTIKESGIILAGIYFYSFAIQPISNKIALDHKIVLQDYIYSVVSISKTSGINISINYANNILASMVCEYPEDKSHEYIQGIIEQNLSDSWAKFKSYIEQNELKKANIFILPQELKALLEPQQYEVEMSIYADSIVEGNVVGNTPVFLSYFNKSEQSQALSSELKSYYRYHLINNILFKLTYSALLLLCLYCANVKKNTIFVENSTAKIYQDYFKITEDIRLRSQNFPGVSNISQLADLYNLQKHLREEVPLPFDYVEDFINLTKDFIKISRISLIDDHSNMNSDFVITLDVMLEMFDHKDSLTMLQEVKTNLQNKYNGVSVETQRTNLQNVFNGNPKFLAIKIIISGGIR